MIVMMMIKTVMMMILMMVMITNMKVPVIYVIREWTSGFVLSITECPVSCSKGSS